MYVMEELPSGGAGQNSTLGEDIGPIGHVHHAMGSGAIAVDGVGCHEENS